MYFCLAFDLCHTSSLRACPHPFSLGVYFCLAPLLNKQPVSLCTLPQIMLLLLLLLLSCFSRVRLCATPWTAAHQGPRPWDSPGKNTGVGCHFLLQCMRVKSLSRIGLLATPCTAAYQAPPSMGPSRQEYWSGLPLCYVSNNKLCTCFCSCCLLETFLLSNGRERARATLLLASSLWWSGG